MNQILEIDNFLNIFQQKDLFKIITSGKIDWYFFPKPSTSVETAKSKKFLQHNIIKDSPALAHIFFQQDYLNDGTYSDFKSKVVEDTSLQFDIVKIFAENIEKQIHKAVTIYRLQVALFLPNPEYNHLHMTPHTDWKFPHQTLIYYVNDSDGDTFIFNEKRDECNNYDPLTIKKQVTPKQGKACIFDGLLYHAASPSKKNLRYIINCNFLVD